MLYTEKEKHEIERVKEVFAEHLRQSPDFELLWSDKVGYVWLTIGVNPLYVDTGIRIESAADLCGRCLDGVATDVLYQAQEYQYQQALLYINNEENLNLTEFNDDFIRRIIEQVTVLSATQIRIRFVGGYEQDANLPLKK